MGLDQYAMVIDPLNNPTDTEGKEIAYWRKHNRLQGWMDALWHAKGNVTPDDVKANWGTAFNGQPLELTLEDINRLEKDIIGRHLPQTGGFFFGSDSYSDYEGQYGYLETDKKFIADAKDALKRGCKVIYRCSW